MSKVALDRISSLTFYKNALTRSRRGQPISQLVCVGKPCNLYQPEAVRCTNAGGSGTDVDWKCEADLPEALRFGQVEVSCEGWNKPGDPYVLKGSCSLEYNLVRVPDALRRPDEPRFPSRISNWFEAAYKNPSAIFFYMIWTACLLFILYSFLKSCWGSRAGSSTSGGTRPRPSGGGPRSGWFSGSTNRPGHNNDPPPPYTKYPASSATNAQAGWRPGFWTGAALGWLGNHVANRAQREPTRAYPAAYDWEHDRMFRSSPAAGGISSMWGSTRRSAFTSSSDDRGEGSSNLGATRRSTGLGGSNVR